MTKPKKPAAPRRAPSKVDTAPPPMIGTPRAILGLYRVVADADGGGFALYLRRFNVKVATVGPGHRPLRLALNLLCNGGNPDFKMDFRI